MTDVTWARVFAPAKVNLALHVTGRREDGHHLLDTLVAFAPVGDRLSVTAANTLSLTVEGPEAAGVPADMDNLALRAAAIFAGERGFALTLTKHLPAASGIGGGSADAAAALRAVLALRPGWTNAHWQAQDEALRPFAEDILALGADVPMCLLARPCRARGIGERIEFVDLPPVPAVLVNPRVPVSTRDVFARLDRPNNPPMPASLPDLADTAGLIGWLRRQRNDLQAPAMSVAPEVGHVLTAIGGQPGCGLARMSGSGATCFGLFADEDDARRAAGALYRDRPDWWVAGGVLGDQQAGAIPEIS